MMPNYASDLTDLQWSEIEPLLPGHDASKGGRPCSYSKREILNAIFYIEKTGCQWRMLPLEFPPWNLVWQHFRHWRDDGTFEQIRLHLNRKVRQKIGKKSSPTVMIADSQSVKTVLKGGSAVLTEGS